MTKATTKGDAVEIFQQSFCQLVILLVSSFSQFDVILFAIFFVSHPSFCVRFRFEIAKNNELCVDTFLCTLDWYFSFYMLPKCKLKTFAWVIKKITNDTILPNFQPIYILGSTWFIAHLLTKFCCCLLSNRNYFARTSDAPRINKTHLCGVIRSISANQKLPKNLIFSILRKASSDKNTSCIYMPFYLYDISNIHKYR